MQRRLSAILAADVVGYSRLMGANEVATLTALKAHRAELIDATIAAHDGRIVKLIGDGMLVEFGSVVNSVTCAAAIQRGMLERNCGVPDDRRLDFRIGINVGDVLVEGDDIFGDGVNIASRIEGIAKPGGIAISGAVRDHLGNRLDLAFQDRGECDLKNIASPVRIYDVALDAEFATEPAGLTKVETVAHPDRPSIAILPFDNMCGDPALDYFSDGIAEDIITDLSKLSGLFVVGRNNSFIVERDSISLQEIARSLGVRFLVEGSFRKDGQRVRVSAQLIDGLTGGHVWADRFDRELTDIFAIQDEITKAIVTQLEVRLLQRELRAIGQPQTANVAAYHLYLKGRHFFHNATQTLLVLARDMFAAAVEQDPGYARAYAGIAASDARLASWYNRPIPAAEILAVADKALELDATLAEAHAARGMALATSARTEEAVASFERALALDPNGFDANFSYGMFCINEGRLERAAALYERALECDPEESQARLLLVALLRSLGRFDEAERYGRMGLRRAEAALLAHPENSRPAQLGAGTLAALGDTEQAKRWLARAMAIDPLDNIALYNAACTYAQLGEIEQAVRMLEQWAENPGGDYARWFVHDSDLDPVRSHPQYRRLLIKLGIDPANESKS